MQKFGDVGAGVEAGGGWMQVFHERGVSIVPVRAGYDYSFGERSEELRSIGMDYRACRWPRGLTEKDIAAHFAAFNSKEISLMGDKVITYSHFLPRIDLMPEFIPSAKKLLYPVLGSAQLDRQLRKLK